MNRVTTLAPPMLAALAWTGCDSQYPPGTSPETRDLMDSTTVRAEIAMIDAALAEFALRNDRRFPETLEVLVIPDELGHTYLKTKSLPTDPWGRAYLYRPPTKEDPVPHIMTYGRDGAPGGTGPDADITNRD